MSKTIWGMRDKDKPKLVQGVADFIRDHYNDSDEPLAIWLDIDNLNSEFRYEEPIYGLEDWEVFTESELDHQREIWDEYQTGSGIESRCFPQESDVLTLAAQLIDDAEAAWREAFD